MGPKQGWEGVRQVEWGELVEASRERDRDPETLTRTSIARPSFAPEAAVPAAPCGLTHLSLSSCPGGSWS